MVIHNRFILPLREALQWVVTFEVYMGNPSLMASGERKGGLCGILGLRQHS